MFSWHNIKCVPDTLFNEIMEIIINCYNNLLQLTINYCLNLIIAKILKSIYVAIVAMWLCYSTKRFYIN